MQLNFDATSVAPSQAMEPMVAGEYTGMITASELKETAKKKRGESALGTLIEFTWQIIDGPYKGRKLWSRINMQNDSKKAVEIGQEDLSAICHAVGVLKPAMSEDLHDKPVSLKVVIAKSKLNGEPINEIKGYKPLAAAQQQQVQQQPAEQQAQPMASDTPPWG
jgi:hypothetical protein|tara:strand:+ start:2771 stop:3262 length:492 start_codon:yes stop_codon:yes gene_type:complete